MPDQPRQKKLVFLVDDDPDFLEIFGTKLSAAGFEMVPFQDPQAALEAVEPQQPDLILLDVQMPKLSGIQMMTALKANPRTAGIKVIFLTNSGTNEEGMAWLDQKFAKEVGAMGHIRKSDDLDAITARVIQDLALQ